jgi:hypothetical protein
MCPGCGNYHAPKTLDDGNGHTWKFNGSLTTPTFFPSLLFSEQGEICHSFVRDGHIHFCSDSTHSAAGQSVPLFTLDNN